MFQTQLNRSSVDLKISVFTWKTLPAAVVTVTQFAAKVFMLMKHATAKEKRNLFIVIGFMLLLRCTLTNRNNFIQITKYFIIFYVFIVVFKLTTIY